MYDTIDQAFENGVKAGLRESKEGNTVEVVMLEDALDCLSAIRGWRLAAARKLWERRLRERAFNIQKVKE